MNYRLMSTEEEVLKETKLNFLITKEMNIQIDENYFSVEEVILNMDEGVFDVYVKNKITELIY